MTGSAPGYVGLFGAEHRLRIAPQLPQWRQQRTCRGMLQSVGFDPTLDQSRQERSNEHSSALFGNQGYGGLCADNENLQVLSLQDQNHLVFRAAGFAFSGGKAQHRRWQPAGVQRRAGHLGSRRTARRLGQYSP
jgi:hypothetical protein